MAGQAIFEIGKRLKHVKENDLVHGEWINWLESIDMDRSEAHRFINVANKLGGANVETFQHLGLSALNLIATIPEEEREKEHVTSKGETKTPDEMTVKELREVKQQLKQAEQRATNAETREQAAKNSEQIMQKKLEESENQEPEEVEVYPDDYDYYKGNYEAAVNMRDRYKEQLEEMRKELNQSSKADDSAVNHLKEKEKRLKEKIGSYEKLYDIQSNLEIVISTISSKAHFFKADDIKNEYQVIDEFDSTLNEVIKVCNELKNKLPDKNIIEGEIVNE